MTTLLRKPSGKALSTAATDDVVLDDLKQRLKDALQKMEEAKVAASSPAPAGATPTAADAAAGEKFEDEGEDGDVEGGEEEDGLEVEGGGSWNASMARWWNMTLTWCNMNKHQVSHMYSTGTALQAKHLQSHVVVLGMSNALVHYVATLRSCTGPSVPIVVMSQDPPELSVWEASSAYDNVFFVKVRALLAAAAAPRNADAHPHRLHPNRGAGSRGRTCGAPACSTREPSWCWRRRRTRTRGWTTRARCSRSASWRRTCSCTRTRSACRPGSGRRPA